MGGAPLSVPEPAPTRGKALNDVAAEAFERAAKAEAAGHEHAPADLDRIGHLVSDQNRTHMAMICTALVARIVNPNLHPASIQAGWVPTWQPPGKTLQAHNGRDLCTKGLVRVAAEEKVSLGVYKREPLQNSPYTQEASVYTAFANEKARDPLADDVIGFVEAVARQDDPEQLWRWLLAYVRVGREVWERDHRDITLGPLRRDFFDLVSLTCALVAAHSERGKWGQALAGAGFELMGYTVPAESVFASRNRVGDIQLTSGAGVVCIEVRQKDRLESDPRLFAWELARNEYRYGAYLDLVEGTDRIDEDELRDIYADTKVVLHSFNGARDFLDTVVRSPEVSPERFVEGFPALMHDWLARMGVSESGRQEWARHFEDV